MSCRAGKRHAEDASQVNRRQVRADHHNGAGAAADEIAQAAAPGRRPTKWPTTNSGETMLPLIRRLLRSDSSSPEAAAVHVPAPTPPATPLVQMFATPTPFPSPLAQWFAAPTPVPTPQEQDEAPTPLGPAELTPDRHARQLIDWITVHDEWGDGLLFVEILAAYGRMCVRFGWSPRPWNPIARELTKRTTGRKVFRWTRFPDGTRHRLRFYPRPELRNGVDSVAIRSGSPSPFQEFGPRLAKQRKSA